MAAKAPDKWKRIGLQLNIEYQKLNTMANQDHINSYADVFSMWQKKGDPPFTWATIIEVLRADSVEEKQLANELKEWLTNEQMQYR